MKTILKIISYCALAATVVPSSLVYTGTIELELHKTIMLVGMIVWFLTAPFWMDRKNTA